MEPVTSKAETRTTITTTASAITKPAVSSPNTPPPPPSQPFTIAAVRTAADLSATIHLFTSYATSLDLDLSFQDFQSEMANMPGKYSPTSGGELFLARAHPIPSSSSIPGEAIGCAALRRLSSSSDTHISEMKRLYVSPQARNIGLGRALALAVIAAAEVYGYDEIRLDTLPSMGAAQAMYIRLGFEDIEPYRFNPVEGARYLGLRLPRSRSRRRVEVERKGKERADVDVDVDDAAPS